jgi:hypothetical protein
MSFAAVQITHVRDAAKRHVRLNCQCTAWMTGVGEFGIGDDPVSLDLQVARLDLRGSRSIINH